MLTVGGEYGVSLLRVGGEYVESLKAAMIEFDVSIG